jgi:fatty-acyl-CoA synthase
MAEATAKCSLPRYGVPERYIIMDEIPKTSVGKLDKKLIRKAYS